MFTSSVGSDELWTECHRQSGDVRTNTLLVSLFMRFVDKKKQMRKWQLYPLSTNNLSTSYVIECCVELLAQTVVRARVISKWLWKVKIICKYSISLPPALALYSICAHTTFFLLSLSDNKQCHQLNPSCDAVSLPLSLLRTHKSENQGTSLNASLSLRCSFSSPFPSDYRVGEHLQIRVHLFPLSSSWQNDKANLLIRSFDSL